MQEGERIVAVTGRRPSQSLAFQVLQSLGADPLSIRDQVVQSQEFGEEIQEERFSLQPSRERLKTLLPPMSNQALKVWHAMGSQMSWQETDTAINRFWIKWLTRLPESEVQAALDELIGLGVIARIELA